MERHEAATIFDFVEFEKLTSNASILARDKICFFENTKRAERDIFKVADGRGNN